MSNFEDDLKHARERLDVPHSYDRRIESSADFEYALTVEAIIQNGTLVPPEVERTDTGVIKGFGVTYVLDVGDQLPVLTTKQMAFESVVAEYLFFLTGSTNVEELQKYTGVWDEWCDQRGNLETAYGRFWRDFPSMPNESVREGEASHPYYQNRHGVDQLGRAVTNIKENPHSRRHHISAWHPDNALASKLPPCHHSFTFYVEDGTLNLDLHQRSGDMALGVPFNMTGYAIVLNLVARETGLEPGLLKHNITDAHIYLNHLDDIVTQVNREPVDSDHTLEMPDKSLFGLEISDVENFSLQGYESRGPIPYDVAV